MKTSKTLLLTGFAAGGALVAPNAANAQYSPTVPFTGHVGKTVAETRTAYPEHNPKARPGAPNVVWIILDDTGFGVSSAFGGLVETPTLDYLAENGLRFNNFHTAAISAATRSCLITGRNHHNNHTGRFNDDRYGAPGYDTYMPMENGTMAEVLRENGYATISIGKYNGAPYVDGTFAGPYNRWPLGRGFDHHYGFNGVSGGEDQWHPMMYRDNHREPDDTLICIRRLANEAINYIADRKSADPEQPFFLYFCPGTSHTPFHVNASWRDKYKGRFDEGWDVYSERVLENQIRLGIVPKGTRMPIVNNDVQRWDSLSDYERKIFARQMEAFAGFMSEADYEIGRVVDFIRRIGELDNTLIIIALGDNGASGEGGRVGLKATNPSEERTRAFLESEMANYDNYGDDRTWPFYPTGWAQACNTPFRYYKKWADYEGGTHDGLIVYYPAGIKEKGGIRTQYTHVTDIFPTTVELTGAKIPEVINGYPQNPVEGTSFAYAVTSENNNVKTRKKVQYYELNASYALYKDGWKVQFPNGAVNGLRKGIYPDKEVHLYNLEKDFNESNDLALKYPKKVKEMLKEFDEIASKNNIYPLKNGKLADEENYPDLIRPHYDVYTGTRGYGEFSYFEGNGGKPYTLTVYIDEAGRKPNGILVSQKGFALYALDGALVYATSTGDRVVASRPLPEGASVVKADVEFKGKKTLLRLYIDDEKVAEETLPSKINLGTKSNYIEVGRQWGRPQNEDYASPFLFSGKIFKCSIDIHK